MNQGKPFPDRNRPDSAPPQHPFAKALASYRESESQSLKGINILARGITPLQRALLLLVPAAEVPYFRPKGPKGQHARTLRLHWHRFAPS